MSDMQRYVEWGMRADDDGPYVLASDAEAAIAAARADERQQMIASVLDGSARLEGRPVGFIDEAAIAAAYERGLAESETASLYVMGQRDMLARCIAELQRLLFREDGSLHSVGSSLLNDDNTRRETPGIEFCCACNDNLRALGGILAALRGLTPQ